MDLRDLALVIDGGIKKYEAAYQVPPSGHYGELHTALVGMREQALALMAASDDRKSALVTELIEEVFGDGDGS